jgi:hypothetical protein
MTYQEILDWLDDMGFFDDYYYDNEFDLGEVYENVESAWDGRGEFEDIMSIDEFINEFELYYSE